VLLVVDLDDTPGVATATDATTVSSGHLGVGTNNGEGNLGHDLLVLSNGLLIVKLVTGTFKDLEGVLFDIGKDLEKSASTVSIENKGILKKKEHTRCLKRATSSSVKVSALAMTGIKLTLVCRRRITSMSRGFREWPVGWMK
jgi:TctA family transporter